MVTEYDHYIQNQGKSVTLRRRSYGEATVTSDYPSETVTEAETTITMIIEHPSNLRANLAQDMLGMFQEESMVGIIKSDQVVSIGDTIDDGTDEWQIEAVRAIKLLGATQYSILSLGKIRS